MTDALILIATLASALWCGWYLRGVRDGMDRRTRDELVSIEADRAEGY